MATVDGNPWVKWKNPDYASAAPPARTSVPGKTVLYVGCFETSFKIFDFRVVPPGTP